MPQLITLEDWARQIYGDAAPAIATLRRWARDARIHPAPQKHGRTYFVLPTARYVDLHAPARTSPPPNSPRRLISRINHGRTPA